MGRKDNKKPRFQKKSFDKAAKAERKVGKDVKYQDVEMKNEKFITYYKTQNILPEEEFDTFVECLKTLLPVSFRITGSRSHAAELRDLMIKEYFPTMSDFEIDGEKIEVPKPLPWYPDNLGWISTLSRSALRKSPQLARFHRFLVAETEVGNISRQEVVSMIPVELLDVKPHHNVLDMCAAPGSKTAQLLEALHANESDAIPEGMVIANDADQNRCYMLVKQAKRLQSPCLMVTNHEAQQFPSIYYSAKDASRSSALRFDRILADVPCSGDGTFRKNKNIWKTWTQGNGNALHRIQLPILLRGASLLRVGGRIVYSTCSFNPMENEAVVAGAIKLSGGALRLVDISNELPALIRKPGLSSWKVQHKDGTFYDAFDDVPEKARKYMVQSMFMPENAAEMNLDRCIRVYPHAQNTGGFFVAVLEKVAQYGALDRSDGLPPHINKDGTVANDDDMDNVDMDAALGVDGEEEDTVESDREAKRLHAESEFTTSTPPPTATRAPTVTSIAWQGGESPFVFLSPTNPELIAMRAFFALSPSFPTHNFVVRSENENWKTVYFVSTAVRNVITAANSFRLRIVNTGIRVFTRNSNTTTVTATTTSPPETTPTPTPATPPTTTTTKQPIGSPFRLSNEGLSVIGAFVSPNNIIHASLPDIITLLSIEYPKFTQFNGRLQSIFTRIPLGSCIVKFDPAAETGDAGEGLVGCAYEGSVRTPILLPVWRAHVSVSLLLNKAERKSLMHRLTGKELEIVAGLESELPGAAAGADARAGLAGGEDGDTTPEDATVQREETA
ncbi:S-adenosyl-L-methionine-dependent methyltransferase [Powellomyces hirtus]|nr:S-adenosyl-L-methionine-dependent methyltransferase [Powellomyces hirtus]